MKSIKQLCLQYIVLRNKEQVNKLTVHITSTVEFRLPMECR